MPKSHKYIFLVKKKSLEKGSFKECHSVTLSIYFCLYNHQMGPGIQEWTK